MQHPIDIQRALPDDLSALAAIDPSAAHTQRHEFLRHAIESGTCYLATRDGAAQGYGVLNYTFFGNGFIELLYVAEQARRSGVGAALMQHMAAECRTEKLFTSTNLSNVPMQALLARLEYALSGVIHHLDEGDPELVYFKRIDRPSVAEVA